MNITASLQIKNNIYQVVLNYKDINGKRKQKWVSTGLSQKGNNKRLANQKMQEILADFKESLNNEGTNNSTDKLLIAYLQEWLLSIKNTIEENTYDSYKVIVNKICDYFEDKTITIKHKAIETRKDNKRVILLKDKTKNQSSYRTLPLVDDIIVLLKEHQKQIDENKKLCGNSYNKKYLDYICVDFTGKLFRPEYVTDHFTLIMKKNKNILRKITFHGLRHSCASLLLSKGIPMKEIQDWLGHSTYSTTANIYAHLEKDTKNKSANVLSNTLTFADI